MPSVIAIMRAPLDANGHRHQRRMDVIAVADDLGGDASLSSTAPTTPGDAAPIGGMRLNRCVACRAPASMASRASSNVAPRVADRHAMAGGDESRTRSSPPGSSGASVTIPMSARCRSITSRMSRAEKCAFGLQTSAFLDTRTRFAQAASRLRAIPVGIDEVALEVRRQHPRGARRSRRLGGSHGRQQRRQALAESQAIVSDRTRSRRTSASFAAIVRDGAAAIEHVNPLDAVDVDVDEAGNDVMSGAVDARGAGRPVDRAGFNRDSIRPSRMTRVPRSRTRSGSTRSAPARTIMRCGARPRVPRQSPRRRRRASTAQSRTRST